MHLLQNESAEIQAWLCSLFMGAPITSLPPAAAQHAAYAYGNEVHVKYGMVTFSHMPTVEFFFMCAMLFNCKRCSAKEDSCMEMRTIMNGWTQEGMNGDQEAVYSGWWKQHLAQGTCHDVPTSDGKSLSE